MTKSWEKYVDKNPYKNELKKIIEDIENDNLSNYHLKPLFGYDRYFRIRKGKIRIVFIKEKDGNRIKAVDTRGDIYKGL